MSGRTGRGEEWSGVRVRGEGKGVGIFRGIFACMWVKNTACENTLISLILVRIFLSGSSRKIYFYIYVLKSCMEKWGSIFTDTDIYVSSAIYWDARVEFFFKQWEYLSGKTVKLSSNHSLSLSPCIRRSNFSLCYWWYGDRVKNKLTRLIYLSGHY